MAIKVEQKISLARYTTFQIGGDADYFCRVSSREDLIEALNYAKKEAIPFRVIGGGSNLLIADKGFRGLIILNRGGNYEVKTDRVFADSGANLSKIARETVDLGFSGLDFATGIPGTIGGAVAGNAGAYGKDMSQVVVSANVWENGQEKKYNNEDFAYDYRFSLLKNDQSRVVLDVTVKLEKGEKEKMLEASGKDMTRRTTSYSGSNAGSYFTNIEEADLSPEQVEKLNKFIVHGKVAVGKIVEELGLKGLRVGGAMVSEGHGNVLVNTSNASAKDVIELERTVIDKVLSAYGIILRPEVTKIGEF